MKETTLGANDRRDQSAGGLSSSAWRVETFCQKILPCLLGLEHSHHPQMEPYALTAISNLLSLVSGNHPFFLWIAPCLAFHISGATRYSVFWGSLFLSQVLKVHLCISFLLMADIPLELTLGHQPMCIWVTTTPVQLWITWL